MSGAVDTPTRSSAPGGEAPLSSADLAIGACVTFTGQPYMINEAALVPIGCAQPHQGEVFCYPDSRNDDNNRCGWDALSQYLHTSARGRRDATHSLDGSVVEPAVGSAHRYGVSIAYVADPDGGAVLTWSGRLADQPWLRGG